MLSNTEEIETKTKNLAPIGSEWKLKKLLASPNIWVDEPDFFKKTDSIPKTPLFDISVTQFEDFDPNLILETQRKTPEIHETKIKQPETQYVDAVRAFAKKNESSDSSSTFRVVIPRRKY